MLHMLGTYRVEQKLAEGGMGSVFLASAPDGRKVVLKVPHAQDRDAAIALADEARTGARLRHPAIIETLDFFVDKGVSVLVVAHIDGPSLYDLRRAGPLPGSAVAEIGVQLAGALHTIHTACDEAGRPLRMLHRDISPNNVLVDRSGQVRLIDLGIARSVDRKQKATSAGMVKGTLRYLAPEILRGGDHDVATDLWALGLTLWEAAMGRYAVAGDPMNTMRAAMAGDILALGDGERIDSDVLDVIQALVCPAEQRMQNAKAAGAVLTRLANKRPGGRDALAEAVAVVATALFEDERTDNVDITLTKDRGMMAPASRPETPDVTAVLPRDEDVASVFTTTTPRDQIAAHAPAPAPAFAEPPTQVRPPTQPAPKPITSVPSAAEGDVFSVEDAPASSSPMSRPSSAAVAVPPPRAPTPRPLPSPVLATASTLLQLPASQLSSTSEVHAAPATIPSMPRFASDVSTGPGAPSVAGLAKGPLSDAPTLLAIPVSQLPSPSQGGPAMGSPARANANANANTNPNAPVSAIGPTMVQLPAQNIGPAVHAAPALPNIHTAPTLQMPAVSPAPLPSETEARGTEPRPAKGSKTDEDLETMATIQMPVWVEPNNPAANAQPKPSLFLPIVIVDDEQSDDE